VGVLTDHPLYGVDYSQEVDYVLPPETPIGKRGIMPMFFHCLGDGKATPDVIFDVHGSLTYSGGDDYPIASSPQLWWFGFDTGHAGDRDNPKSLTYCIEECKGLAQQLATFQLMKKED
jgi:hypothetical protein